MRLSSTTIVFVLACFGMAALAAGCMSAGYDENGNLTAGISPWASLDRVQKSELAANERFDAITDSVSSLANGQQALAVKVGDELTAAQAEQIKIRNELADAKKKQQEMVQKVEDQAASAWVEYILYTLGIGGLAGGGMAYRKKLLKTPPPDQSAA